MNQIAIPEGRAELESMLESLPASQAVYLLWPRAGRPQLARTNVLRKRLRRVLRSVAGGFERLEYCLTGSRLESQFLLLEFARKYLGRGYREAIRLRLPPWVKLTLANEFARTLITTRIGRAKAVYFGPFRNRSTAARFDSECLDLFQLRRCQENLTPAPDHPGCMYGEMGRCLRPCQQAVGADEYRHEAARVGDFFRTNGKSLLAPAESARDTLSGEMNFEGAALMHQRCQKIVDVLTARDEMVRELTHLDGVAVVPSVDKEAVNLGWLRGGYWRGFTSLEFTFADGRAVSLDSRLREIVLGISDQPCAGGTERAEQLAVLARWRYSGWCDGELLLFDDWGKIPYRKLVNAVSRVVHGQSQPRPGSRS